MSPDKVFERSTQGLEWGYLQKVATQPEWLHGMQVGSGHPEPAESSHALNIYKNSHNHELESINISVYKSICHWVGWISFINEPEPYGPNSENR